MTTEEEMLRGILHWLKGLGYKAPEVFESDRQVLIHNISALLERRETERKEET